jgi:hypothetical protein
MIRLISRAMRCLLGRAHKDSPRERTQKQAKTDHQSRGSTRPVTGCNSRPIFGSQQIFTATRLSQGISAESFLLSSPRPSFWCIEVYQRSIMRCGTARLKSREIGLLTIRLCLQRVGCAAKWRRRAARSFGQCHFIARSHRLTY